MCLVNSGVVCAQSTATFKPGKWTAIFGVHIGRPDRFSVVMGVGRVVSSRQIGAPTSKGKFSHTDRDIFVAVEPGSRGSRVSVGYGALRDEISSGTLLSARVSAYMPRSNDSSGVYVGPEISGSELADLAIGLRAGMLFRVAGPPGARRWIVPLDYAVGW
jgi:hypothetical protein